VDGVEVLTLAGAPVDLHKGKYRATMEDVNGDGLTDLVVRVVTSLISCDGAQAALTGLTFDGKAMEGVDSIMLVGD
jgi:hypothetical protein